MRRVVDVMQAAFWASAPTLLVVLAELVKGACIGRATH
jgi:hypothetical protein